VRPIYQKSNPFPRGSEWRKWDLHVHAPGGRLNDGYTGNAEEAWTRFCRLLAESDVEAFGITDYFSLDTFFECRRRFQILHPETPKVFFANVELRLNESVNRDEESVELHILLRHDLEEERGRTLLAQLTTEIQEPGRGRALPCSELQSTADFERATVTRERVLEALEKTFGKDQPEDPRDFMLIVPANRGGLRSETSKVRKSQLADRIDEMVHGIFGTEANVAHYLDQSRAKGEVKLPARPVFAGSDAHRFEDLEAWLGRQVRDGVHKSVTWIKADPNFDGLLQTRAEPEGRVRIQATKPDPKDPYRYLTSVSFSNSEAFPNTVLLNQNLVAVIGPRSSGKSSLLAHIAHAIDPAYTEKRQGEIVPRGDELGPAAGVSWAQAGDVEVEWAEPNTSEGRVIFVPQNALYAISQRPGEITEKIEPSLRRADPEFDVAMRQMSSAVGAASEKISLGVGDWFRNSELIDSAISGLRDRGDREAIERTRDELGVKIAAKREASALSEDEAKLYEQVMDELSAIEARLSVIDEETHLLGAHLQRRDGTLRAQPLPQAELRVTPGPSELPEALQHSLAKIIDTAESSVVEQVVAALISYQSSLDEEGKGLRDKDRQTRERHSALIQRNEANSEIEELTKSRRRQDELLEQIKADEKRLVGLRENLAQLATQLDSWIAEREAAIIELTAVFRSKERAREPMIFGLEIAIDPQRLTKLEERFNQASSGPYMKAGGHLDIKKCHAEPGPFLAALRAKEQKLKRGADPAEVAVEVLSLSPELRFLAEIEGDHIGGFKSSSMSPGKQALFALSLILDDSDEAWPLLIDQPEDDLDSRSIATQLVDYLIARKRERQIIMVSHDANLVIGADAEQVIVANRHGVNTRNADDRTFDYFSGSLEHTRERRQVEIELECGGIREHACDILDGGEEAFRKRKRKYKI
jgi:ABC-type Mn2+/Zn2+ transport system ATPase subunit